MPKVMQQSEFRNAGRAESVRLSRHQFQLVVHTFHGSCRNRTFGRKPVEQKWRMVAKAIGDFLQRFQVRPHDCRNPAVQELAGPCTATVIPELLKVLAHQIALHGPQVVSQQILQPNVLFRRQILRPLQNAPAGSCQHWLMAVPLESFHLVGPDLVQGLAEEFHHMKPVSTCTA
jgi:hypothetical protein